MPATKQSRGLGKGFDALLPKEFDSSVLLDAHDRVQKLDISKIKPSPDQPRRHFDEEALRQLADSIKQYGVIQPIVVTAEGDAYLLVAGERRWRASKLAGLKTIPAIVRSHKELERLEVAIVENVQRVDLSPLEQAASIEKLHQQFNMSYDDIAKRLGKAVSTITNTARLLQLPEESKSALHEKQISEGHARQVLALKGYPEKQQELLDLIVKNDWSVRQAERFVTAFKATSPNVKANDVAKKIRSETPETKKLGQVIKAPVSIRRTAKGGKLEIGFNSDSDLERLIEMLLRISS